LALENGNTETLAEEAANSASLAKAFRIISDNDLLDISDLFNPSARLTFSFKFGPSAFGAIHKLHEFMQLRGGESSQTNRQPNANEPAPKGRWEGGRGRKTKFWKTQKKPV